MTDLAYALPPHTSGGNIDSLKWLAIWTKPRAEKATARILEARNIAHWLPTLRVRRRWSDRWKEIDVPLFPGYLFARVDADTWQTLLSVRGVLTVVKSGRAPAWIRDHQMDDLLVAVERMPPNDFEPAIVEDFERGDRVRVTDGPMVGLVGVVRETRGNRRLLVGFEQIGRALSVSIGAASVERDDD